MKRDDMVTEMEVTDAIKGWLYDAMKFGGPVLVSETYALIRIATQNALERVFDDYEEDLIKANEE